MTIFEFERRNANEVAKAERLGESYYHPPLMRSRLPKKYNEILFSNELPWYMRDIITGIYDINRTFISVNELEQLFEKNNFNTDELKEFDIEATNEFVNMLFVTKQLNKYALEEL